MILRYASVRVRCVVRAHQLAVDVAPDSSPTRMLSARAATRSSSSANLVAVRVKATSVDLVPAAPIDQAGWSTRAASSAAIRATAALIG